MFERLLVKLVCKIKGHKELRVIDSVEVIKWTPVGPQMQITRQHMVCMRCDKNLTK